MAFNVKDSIDIKASTDDILEVLLDFDSYPEWNPEIKKIEVKERDEDGRAHLVYWQVDARLRTVAYTLRYDYSGLPNSYTWERVEGDVKSLSGTYTFDEFDDVTEVTYELSLDPGFPVPGLFRRQGERQLKEAALDKVKKRVEG